MNDAILNSNKHTFCTAVYSTLERIDPDRWRYTIAIGGHPRPIRLPRGASAELLGTHGTLIGMIPELAITVDSYDLAPGDAIVLYTDGVTDLRPPHALTEERFAEIVDLAVGDQPSADSIAGTIGLAIHDLMPIPDRHDDVALLVVRIDD